ncbi:MAG TPA: hypothetical protein VFP29_10520 [Methyloceanibacter sp.]|nr:hypothetical protein [Methyloceanibacter sp.]
MSATTNLQSGSVTTSIPTPTKPSGSPPKSMPSPRNGPASPQANARDVGWSTPDADADWGNDFLDARKARLGEVLEDLETKTLKYLYDFGDGWEHTIKIERLTDPEPGMVYPRLTVTGTRSHVGRNQLARA